MVVTIVVTIQNALIVITTQPELNSFAISMLATVQKKTVLSVMIIFGTVQTLMNVVTSVSMFVTMLMAIVITMSVHTHALAMLVGIQPLVMTNLAIKKAILSVKIKTSALEKVLDTTAMKQMATLDVLTLMEHLIAFVLTVLLNSTPMVPLQH